MAEAEPIKAALVLYAAADEPFVRGFLLPALDTTLEAHDPLTLSAAELDQALARSAVVVAVISAAFLADPWTRASEAMATDATKARPELAVVPLVLDDVALPTHIAYRMTLAFQDRADWDTQAERLRGYLARPVAGEPAIACPYPGMRPFQAGDAAYFRGRSTELSAIRTMIAGGDREIYLVGPSGSGKSSLIYAGLLPQLEHAVIATMRPGDAPLHQLAACLAVPEATPAAIAAWGARQPDAQLVVFVDQLEELFALAAPAEQAGFAAALAALRATRAVVILALRADFYGELQLSALWTDAGRRHVDLPPLRGPALREAIVEPARAMSVYLETALTERLLADAAGEPGVLPLLQETLVQLWGHRRHCLLTLAAYDALGDGGHSGLAVAVTTRADRCLAEMTPAQAALARLVLLRLVSFGEGRPNTRRRQTRGQLATGIAGFDDVLGKLVDARLVTVDADGQVDLAHEVLIAAWPSFATWIESRRADEQRRRQIQASAEAWIARGRGATGLLDAGELATAVVWRTTDAARELGESAEVTQLIDASRHAQARVRWLRRIAVAAVVVVAMVIGRLIQLSASASGEAAHQTQLAAAARAKATRALAEQFRELGRQFLVDGHPLRAIPMLVAAREQGLDDAPLRMMFHAARPTAIEHAWPGGASVVAYSPDGRELAIAGEHGVQRRDAATGAAIGALLPHPSYVNLMAYAPDGAHLVTMITGRKTAWLWDLAAATAHELTHDGPITWVQVSPDGSRVVTASRDSTVRLWDVRTGALLRRFDIGKPVRYAELNRDNSRLATTLNMGSSVLRSTSTGAPQSGINDKLARYDNSNLVQSARFNAGGDLLVTTSSDGQVEIWEVASDLSSLRHPIVTPASDAMFSPDGTRILTIGVQDLQLWHQGDGDSERVASRSFSAPLGFARFDRTGNHVLVVSDDRTVRVWTPATDRLEAISLETDPADADLSPDGMHVATASQDAARIWQLASTAARVITPPGQPIDDVAFSPDGKWLVTGDSFGRISLRGADGATIRELDTQRPLGTATFAGDRLMVSDENGLARLIELAPLTMHPVPRDPARRAETGNTQGAGDLVYGHLPAAAAISADGHRIAMLGDHEARVWDADTGRPITPPLPHAAELWAIRFSPDATRVATAAGDGNVQLWDAQTGARIGAAMTHPTKVYAIELSPDGRTLAAVSADAKVSVWDLATARRRFVVQHADRVLAATFSPDGTRLLTYGIDHTAKILDVATGLAAIPELHQDDGYLHAAFSPDGTRIVTVSPHWVQIWDASTGRPLLPPLPHTHIVSAAAFSPDGNTLATAAHDGARLWDVGLDNRSLAAWQAAATAAGAAAGPGQP